MPLETSEFETILRSLPTPLEVLLDPISLSLLLMVVAMLCLQSLLPGRKLPAIKGWWVRGTAVFIVYFYLSTYLPMMWDRYLIEFQLFNLAQHNPYVSTLIAVFVFELLIYIWHRTMHSTPLLWRTFHQMHHSAERVDTLGAFYFSPLDAAGFAMIGSLTLSLVVGLPPEAVTSFLFVTFFLAMFQHTNVKTPQWLGYFIQRPESHSVHHQLGVHGYNYSDLPVFDLLFGTFKNPRDFARETGFYDGASARVGDMLLFRDISDEPSTSAVGLVKEDSNNAA
ncbi:MAG: sterol desaturase family protein [Cellvibrionaceae bacterium]